MAAREAGGVWRRYDRLVEQSLYSFCGLLLIVMTSIVFYSVVARYVFNSPPIWSEDVPLVLFQWLTYLAIAVATKRGQNIRVTYFIAKLAPPARKALEVTMHAMVIAMLVVLFRYSFPVIAQAGKSTMLSTGWSNAWLYYPMPIGVVLMGLYQVTLLRRSLRGESYGEGGGR